jgi:gluconolactonase
MISNVQFQISGLGKIASLALAFSLSAFISPVQAQDSGLIAEGAKLTLISDQFSFTEGPAVDKKGNIFFTDQPNDRIWKYDTDGKLTMWLEPTKRSNGLFFDNKGNLIACADGENELLRISKKKKIEVLVKEWDGKRLNGPNDVWVHSSGGIYFTDPFYARDYWQHKDQPQTKQRLYYRSPSGKVTIVGGDEFLQPNGVVGKGNTLFVTDMRGRKTFRFDIQPDGSLTNKTLICEQGSDGLALDEKGNLYLVGRGVTIYSPEGKVLERINVPEGWTANLTFGGKDRKTLFITASKSVFMIRMNVKGA